MASHGDFDLYLNSAPFEVSKKKNKMEPKKKIIEGRRNRNAKKTKETRNANERDFGVGRMYSGSFVLSLSLSRCRRRLVGAPANHRRPHTVDEVTAAVVDRFSTMKLNRSRLEQPEGAAFSFPGTTTTTTTKKPKKLKGGVSWSVFLFQSPTWNDSIFQERFERCWRKRFSTFPHFYDWTEEPIKKSSAVNTLAVTTPVERRRDAHFRRRGTRTAISRHVRFQQKKKEKEKEKEKRIEPINERSWNLPAGSLVDFAKLDRINLNRTGGLMRVQQ